MKLLALAVAAALAAPVSAGPLGQAYAKARRINGHNFSNFRLDIAQICGSSTFAIPTWCAQPGDGVQGGVERVLEAPAGRRVRFLLDNEPGPWNQPVDTERVFALVKADGTGLPAGGCPVDAVACAKVALGRSEVLITGLEVGEYKYYDPSWPGSGYGLLRIVPDQPDDTTTQP